MNECKLTNLNSAYHIVQVLLTPAPILTLALKLLQKQTWNCRAIQLVYLIDFYSSVNKLDEDQPSFVICKVLQG